MQDHIINIETRCEAPETDTCYEGAHLSAEYDADYDYTKITGQTFPVKDALRGLDGARWNGSSSAWFVDGNKVAHVRNADAHWAGGRTTLNRRIASALRNPMRDECAWCGDVRDLRVAEVTEAATCTAAEPQVEEPARKFSLRPVVAAAIKGAAHAVRSARARKAWETRRRNAARQAEILAATCEPLVTDGNALPPSVAYSATPSIDCCHGRTAHGTGGRVVVAIVGGPIAEWSDVRHDWLRMAHTEDQYCDRGTVVTDGKDDVQILVDHALQRVDTSRCPRVRPWPYTDTRSAMFSPLCLTPDEGRRERRNARRRELYRQRRASAAAAA